MSWVFIPPAGAGFGGATPLQPPKSWLQPFCGIQNNLCGVLHVAHSMWHVAYSMGHGVCGVWHTPWGMRYGGCSIQSNSLMC